MSASEAGNGFPSIPGVSHPSEACRLHLLDFGPEFERGVITHEPPNRNIDAEYAVLVSKTDPDGNEIAGIRTPHVTVPLATYTGWNFRSHGSSDAALKGTVGSYFPLPASVDERQATGDGRESVEERYGSVNAYVSEIEAAARELVAQRLLLEEDLERYVAAAATLSLG